MNQSQLDCIDDILRQDLIDNGVSCSILIDSAGNIVTSLDDGCRLTDIYSIACLTAGNYGAVKAMANLIGEQDFSLLFHRGSKMGMHLRNITSDYLLINIFCKDLSLGFLRLKVVEVILKLREILTIPFLRNNDSSFMAALPQKEIRLRTESTRVHL
jgi:hypothetical protein